MLRHLKNSGKLKGKLSVPDEALLEFEIVLKFRDRTGEQIEYALLALKKIFSEYVIWVGFKI